jgi:hypothetical protein
MKGVKPERKRNRVKACGEMAQPRSHLLKERLNNEINRQLKRCRR